MLKNAPEQRRGFAPFPPPLTLDKMMRDRKHLVSAEVGKLLEAAKGSRNAARDRCLLLLMFRHGLRVSEACGLKLSHVDIDSRVLHVTRLKAGLSTTHPLRGDELRAIKTWLVARAKMKPATDAFFVSERRGPLSRKTAWVMNDPRLWQARRSLRGSPPTHAAPCLRLCPCRSGRRHAIDPRLPGAPEYSAHRQIHGDQSRPI
jgi:integrase